MAKFSKGPWSLEKIQRWPFGVKITSGDLVVLHQDAHTSGTGQKTREDNENGVGFKITSDFCTRDQAIANVAEQDANARVITAAPELYEALKSLVENGGEDDGLIAISALLARIDGPTP